MLYNEQLESAKKYYPFDNWQSNYEEGLEQYTIENCNKTKWVFDNLIEKLIGSGENSEEQNKIELFKIAVESLNKLNDEIDGLIETGEREIYVT